MVKGINPLRKRIVVNKKLQYLITGFFVGIVVVHAIFALVIFQLFTQGVLAEVSQLSAGPKIAMTKGILDQSQVAILWVVAFSVFLVLFAWLAGVIILHRVAGPAEAIKNYLNQVKEGQRPARHPLKFRDGDFMQETADGLSVLAEDYLALREKNK
ncbi:MAG: hypothetical protein H6626_00795 [Pseudobdellovibrionaceae bacterium]|nr:hypothetical protein [Bdellovibrionales bacterium]USN47661.1 MAG: hypothetical protein H6626_00795 [Pseudobdellovibrionaceae bacterium]